MQINYKCQDSLEKSVKSLTFFKTNSENYACIHCTLSKAERKQRIIPQKFLGIDKDREHFISLITTLQTLFDGTRMASESLDRALYKRLISKSG